jgi:hypothetical protein
MCLSLLNRAPDTYVQFMYAGHIVRTYHLASWFTYLAEDAKDTHRSHVLL